MGKMVGFFILWLCLLAMFSGCSTPAALLGELAKDPASNCVILTTPYGGLLMARATPGVTVNLAGGTCTVASPRPNE